MTDRPTLPQTPGRGSQGGGWTQPLSEVWTQLCAEMRGLKERLEGAGLHGVPASYAGKRSFIAEEATVVVVNPVNDADVTTHYIIRDGQTYDIPIYFPGPGIFIARRLEVTIKQAIGNQQGQDLRTSRNLTTQLAKTAAQDGNLRKNRWSLFDIWPIFEELGGDPLDEWSPAMNYFWNLSDAKSSRRLADDLVSHLALLPMSPSVVPTLLGAVENTSLPLYTPVDGATFFFDAPWLFERDGQATFHFRPITAMYGSVNVATDNTGSFDAGTAVVQVELHGERYENLQDAMRSGAMTRPVRRDER